MLGQLRSHINKQVPIAPLAMFRVVFGLMMLLSAIRFAAKGWIKELYVDPVFHFSYYGFEWVKPFGETGMYLLYGLIVLSALMIMIGCFYRIFSIVFFIAFTYTELIDKTYYLNHYYFVSLVAFLMIFMPAHRYFSIDTIRKPSIKSFTVPVWSIGAIRLQLGMVYFFAGIAKLNPDWLFNAMPLKIWLPPLNDTPLIGSLFNYELSAYAFSWISCLYDLTIAFFLINKITRRYAYALVVVFHMLTAILFPIGMFPYIMIGSTLIFFSAEFHEKLILFIQSILPVSNQSINSSYLPKSSLSRIILPVLAIYFVVQVLLPFRYALYPGKLFWTEQGYRFSWRVMLMEKYGKAFFYIKDKRYPGMYLVNNSEYLTPNQEKMMATQPDMILQFAHFLKEEFDGKKVIENGDTLNVDNPEVLADVYVTLNGKGSRPMVDKSINLANIKDGFLHKKWVLPYMER